MDGPNCPLKTTENLKALLGSGESEKKEQAIAYLVGLLTSRSEQTRVRGYELFKEGINDALFCSCLNYRSLVGSFTHPLLEVVSRALEVWANSRQTAEPKDAPSGRSQQP